MLSYGEKNCAGNDNVRVAIRCAHLKLTAWICHQHSQPMLRVLRLARRFCPEDLTKRIGISPTDSCLKGARNPKLGTPKASIWNVSTERMTAECIDVYELADQVIDLVEGKTNEIRKAIQELELYAILQVEIHFSTEDDVSTPAIGFSSRVLDFLTNVGATIDIDTYILPTNDARTE